MWNLIKSLRTENSINNVNTTDEILVSRRGTANFFRLTLNQLKEYFTGNITESTIETLNVTDINATNTITVANDVNSNGINTSFLSVGNTGSFIETIYAPDAVAASTGLTHSMVIVVDGTSYYIPLKPV